MKFNSGKSLSREERVQRAIELASFLIKETKRLRTKEEKKREKRLAKMITDPVGKTFLTLLADQVFRSKSELKTLDSVLFLIKKYGIPTFLNETDRIKFLVFQYFGKYFPHYFVPEIKKNIRKEMAHVLLPDDPHAMENYLTECRGQNIRININHLGEAILGEKEAERRLKVYLEDLQNPLIEYISIKISTIFSQINQIGWEYSLERLSERLRQLFRAAQKNLFLRKDGKIVEKFVNLDMEEYKDLHLTVALFQKVLNEEEFHHLKAGIVLQSYIPDSFLVQQQLTHWAEKRVKTGSAPIKIRIVKGANLAMETQESSLKGWPKPTFENKIETDANFKRMLEYACESNRTKAVHIGVGSHNLFDICYALILRSEKNLENEMEIEMLQGMATPMQKAVQTVSKDMLLYCPEAKEKDFHNAVAYLVRRLDENSGPENFLRDMFQIKSNNLAWQIQKNRFQNAVHEIDTVSQVPKRTQNRFNISEENENKKDFQNEPDTDFSLENNRKWALDILEEWKNKKFPSIPLVISGKEMEGEKKEGIDPSRPLFPFYNYSLASLSHIDLALKSAKNYEKVWQNMPFKERYALLGNVANGFRKKRKDLIGAMVADTGKTIWEADPEVSEAVDFIEYYRRNWEELLSYQDLNFTAKGTLLVTPPWNFPCSIPTGSIAGALTAGNCVLFKPAPEAVLVGWIVVQIFWDAGVPKDVLQFINCEEETSGNALIQHPDLNGVLLTGATSTALKFMKLTPGIDLNAETGGKNALIITAMSDRDLAIRDLLQSSFSHSGQKCSACSLAILEAEVYDDPHFLQQLKDATESLVVGSAWLPHTKIGPLIREPEGALKRGLTQLEPGESWLVEPKCSSENTQLWSCGIKMGVKKGSFTHQTELFGPVLGLMRAESLEEALTMANDTPYGLTSGLHSLDEREHDYWKERMIAGNLYINRSITGAIVRRQPFGGCKASSFGSEAKAGGPNYVLSLSHVRPISLPKQKGVLPATLVPLVSAIKNFGLTEEEQHIWKKSYESYAHFAPLLKKPEDVTRVLGQDNFFYHVPCGKTTLRVIEPHILSLLQVIAACLICETPLEISSTEPVVHLPPLPGIELKLESEETFLKRLKKGRVRTIGKPNKNMFIKAAEAGAVFQYGPVCANGRVELLHYLREVSLSVDYHRYGYLGVDERKFSKT